MKMKRGITTLLSVAVLSTSLVACSGTPEKTVAKEEKVKLTDQQLMADLW
ncbi:5'-nucleotidase, lipoprotein e(P4) family, partial [Bacillus sp. D-CC]